jgi:hypothetical protein
MPTTTSRVTVSLNTKAFEEFKKLSDEFREAKGENVNLSAILNETLKQTVLTLRDFLDKYKKGKLTPDYMARHFMEVMHSEESRVMKEIKKADKKRKA